MKVFSFVYIQGEGLKNETYLEATIVHLREKAVDAARLVIALAVMAGGRDLCGVQHKLVTLGAVDLRSVEA